jgi:DoxX-like family
MEAPIKVLAAQIQDAWRPGKSFTSVRTVSYWIFTFLVAFEMTAGGIWDLLRIEYVRVVLAHLGYPMYLLTILGVWKIPCAMVLVFPGFQRLKEWAYAGAVFNYTGAAASHFIASHHAWAGPLVLAGFTLASWALRSPARRLPEPEPSSDGRAAAWLVPILLLIVMFIVSLVTLPKGPPPS